MAKDIEIKDGDVMEFDRLATLTNDDEPIWFQRLGNRGYRWHRAVGFKVYVYAAQDGGYDSIVNVQARCGASRRVDYESGENADLRLVTEPDTLHARCEKCEED